MNYIATFYSHFGAIRYKKMCVEKNIQAELKPVPRDLSSSCGTCVFCSGELFIPQGENADEIELIVEVTDKGYNLLYSAQ